MATTGVKGDPPRSPAAIPSPLRRLPRSRLPGVLAGTLVPLAILLLAWQPIALVPGPGLDASWTAGLSMAVHDGIPFGSRAIFTYGPLGFLGVTTLWYGNLSLIALVYVLALRFAVALALFMSTRRTFGTAGAFVLAVIIASVGNGLDESVAFLIAAVWAVTADLNRRAALWVAVAAGAASGLGLLGKISTGAAVTTMTAVLVLSLPGRRREYAAAAAAALLATVLVLWLIAGQPLGALPDYVKYSEQIASGYAAAMSLVVPGLGWQTTAAVVALAFGLWGALHMTSERSSRQRWGVALLWVAFWWFGFKEGFVRHDSGHAPAFFGALLGGFLAFRWRAGHRLAALACVAALLCIALASAGLGFNDVVDPIGNVRTAFNQIGDLARASRRDAITAGGRALIEAYEPIDAASLSMLAGHTVDVYPVEIALAWAYRLDWDPMPVLQSYAAYTTALDDADAQFLASTQAPQRILWQNVGSIDGRVLSFDQGRTSRTMLCRYRELRVAQPFAVLGRATNRCSNPVALKTVHAGWDQAVRVPALPNDHSLVFVRIDGADVGGLERVRALLFKPAERGISVNGAAPNRLVAATASDGLPLRASPGMDFAAPFNVAPNLATIAVSKAGQGPTSGGPLTFSFYSQSFDAGPIAPEYALSAASEAIIATTVFAAGANCQPPGGRRSRALVSAGRALGALAQAEPLKLTAIPAFAGESVSQVAATLRARCPGLGI